MGLREIESKDESVFCTEKSDFEVYLPRAWCISHYHTTPYLIAMRMSYSVPRLINFTAAESTGEVYVKMSKVEKQPRKGETDSPSAVGGVSCCGAFGSRCSGGPHPNLPDSGDTPTSEMGSDAVDKYDAFVAFTNENEARAIEFLQSVVDGGASLAHIKNKVHLSTSHTRSARRTTQRKKTQTSPSAAPLHTAVRLRASNR